MEHEMRKQINKFKDFLKENSEEKLNISDVRSSKLSFDEYVGDVMDELNKRFDLTTKEIDEIIDWYRDDIEDAFFGSEGYINVKKLVNSFVVDGKLKWKR